MAKAVMNLASVSNYFANCPPRIQDVPKHILQMYGIVVVSDDFYESSEDEEGALIIDEKPPIKLQKPVFKTITISKPNKAKKEKYSPELFALIQKGNFCEICLATIIDSSIDDHMKKHCSQTGCTDLIQDDHDREKHTKMHNHPTKPFLCKYCRKRYRFRTNVDKHLKICKVYRKKICNNYL